VGGDGCANECGDDCAEDCADDCAAVRADWAFASNSAAVGRDAAASAAAASGGSAKYCCFFKTMRSSAGLYPVHMNLWATASGFGGVAENLFRDVVMVPVESVRSARPSVACPIGPTHTAIAGTAAANATVRVYFDRMLLVNPAVSIGLTSLTPPSSGSVGRIQWTDFLESLPKALHKTVAEVPIIEDQAYIRELLQLSMSPVGLTMKLRLRVAGPAA